MVVYLYIRVLYGSIFLLFMLNSNWKYNLLFKSIVDCVLFSLIQSRVMVCCNSVYTVKVFCNILI